MTGYDPSAHDRWLDPPDEPKYTVCDNCGERFDTGDLNKVKKAWRTEWMCDDCYEIEKAKENKENV